MQPLQRHSREVLKDPITFLGHKEMALNMMAGAMEAYMVGQSQLDTMEQLVQRAIDVRPLL
jgi:hypothetical protein